VVGRRGWRSRTGVCMCGGRRLAWWWKVGVPDAFLSRWLCGLIGCIIRGSSSRVGPSRRPAIRCLLRLLLLLVSLW
jgi:hypothetical protein